MLEAVCSCSCRSNNSSMNDSGWKMCLPSEQEHLCSMNGRGLAVQLSGCLWSLVCMHMCATMLSEGVLKTSCHL